MTIKITRNHEHKPSVIGTITEIEFSETFNPKSSWVVFFEEVQAAIRDLFSARFTVEKVSFVKAPITWAADVLRSAAIAKFHKLKTIVLENCQAKPDSKWFGEIPRFPFLEEVFFRGTNISEEQVNKLRKKLAGVKIIIERRTNGKQKGKTRATDN